MTVRHKKLLPNMLPLLSIFPREKQVGVGRGGKRETGTYFIDSLSELTAQGVQKQVQILERLYQLYSKLLW